ncbi:tRNA adenosine(34) deaminase TadA [Fructilactobacillus sanfranciscensis]|uniref:tRNA adenosine(34) deaminase TadA n=1 Tax=Fructilactobacillus sanfranciscensis TaxID=1625 RepID=UPI0006F17E2B|nr:tRNA adenosine(34) deaminase TadA [Fructilactobacillus sanfranciscensis]KRM80457.1 tRNA-specific adenosine deaminase [Fructilactobacillus sanfranciscensis DSM 20451]MCG7195841.1 nucleoside deaminase [Fructilactobacillus sanfranciscensis]NDR97666.1 nucleoside deaminase [Fructilactobacillus sanfranciscensis]POH11199.1 tRNA-specific adenosine deaminase [Fructilactobacillus sanfranciscensis]POH12093.1 tRNA-specific adenosine deaminase [Fructilactobacillus sanfranciscensis]
MTEIDQNFMEVALREANFAAQIGEVPIGAAIVKDGKVIATAHNLREHSEMATQHAEIIAIEAACTELKSWRLTDCTLYVTIEPCVMCAGAILNARIDRVVYGAMNQKGGAVGSLYNVLTDSRQNHQVEVIAGVKADNSAHIMKKFFKSKRKRRNH